MSLHDANRPREPEQCPICGKWHIRDVKNVGQSCCVMHYEGSCCHFNDEEVSRGVDEIFLQVQGDTSELAQGLTIDQAKSALLSYLLGKLPRKHNNYFISKDGRKQRVNSELECSNEGFNSAITQVEEMLKEELG